MEFNGFDWRLLNLIYLSLFLAKLLQSQAGQDYAEELGLGPYFGNSLMLAVTGVVIALTLWSLLTLELPLLSRDLVQRLQHALNASNHS
jgi:ABC-type glycerol-3-phosphate transport system permease component